MLGCGKFYVVMKHKMCEDKITSSNPCCDKVRQLMVGIIFKFPLLFIIPIIGAVVDYKIETLNSEVLAAS